MPYILEIENVSKSFGELKAVSNISFKVEEGTIFGIAGPNGAGKSTLFNVITKIPFSPDSGKIYYKTTLINAYPAYKLFYIGIARTFQRESIFDSLTVLDNVLVSNIHKKNEAFAYKILEKVYLSKALFGQISRNISIIDKKKLMLASALISEPRLLFLDEPTSGLNKSEVEEFIGILNKINKEDGITIVLIEHVLHVLIALSSKIMLMNEGKKILEDLPEEVINNNKTIDIYLGKGIKYAK